MARILSVDDEAMVSGILKRLLESKGHEVSTALDGPTALQIVKSTELDLVISDIRMLPMNGIELLRHIREVKADLPVIMLTAYASPETKSEADALGASDYLTKPFTGDEVFATVQRVLAAAQDAKYHLATVDEAVREYMVRTGLHNACEAKIELADELYWLEQDNPRANLLAAMNDALGKTSIPMSVMDELLAFRETAVRVKQLVASGSKSRSTDPSKQLLDIAKKVAAAHAANLGDGVKTLEYAADQLNQERGVLKPEDLHFLQEYYEAWNQSRGRKKPPAKEKKPAPSSL